jgi:putative ABC transport system permease protein
MNDPPVLRQALRLVRRELRGGLRGFGVFLACLLLGVFAITAIGSFSAAARSGLLADAGALLGGDLEVRQAHRPLDPQQLEFLARQGRVSGILSLRTMAASPDGERRALVEVKGVDGNYPLYGALPLEPEQSLAQALARHDGRYGALVEAAFLQRFGIKVGDRVAVGGLELTIRGVLLAEPDRSIRPFNLGPRLMVSAAALAATNLIQPGSLVDYSYRLKMPDREQAEHLKGELLKTFPKAGWRIRSWREAAPRVRYFLDRMSANLTLFGLCALLVGGLGVSGAVRGYLSGKVSHIATMKCLGASGRLIFVAYLLQVLILGGIGSGAGILLGAVVPYLLAFLFGSRLPIPLQPAIFPEVVLLAALFGLLIALLFSLKELGIARRVPAAVLFRGYVETGAKEPGRYIWLAIAGVALLLAALALFSSSDRRLACWFILGAALCFALFRLLATLVIRLARRLPRAGAPWLRLGIASISRPGSPAGSVLFSLGLGLTALVLITLVQANLNDMVSETIPAEAPAFFFLDIQPQQVRQYEKILAGFPELAKAERFPTLRGRITAIAGVPVEEAVIAPEVRWAVRGDRFLSYSATLPDETEMTAGQWWPADYRGPPRISLTADLAKGFGVGVGDTLTVNILGRELTGEIANLRQVDWSTLKLNFAILFSPGVLESAPQTHLAAVYLPAEREEALYRAVTGGIENLSAISTREVLRNVAQSMERIGAAFKGMAAIALLTGFLVLAGAVSADQHRRIHDAVIFKVCGATRGDILLAFASEFVLLGLAASLISALVGSLAALAVLKGPLDVPFSPHPEVVLGTLLGGVGLTLMLGLLGTWKALGQKPASYLRDE